MDIFDEIENIAHKAEQKHTLERMVEAQQKIIRKHEEINFLLYEEMNVIMDAIKAIGLTLEQDQFLQTAYAGLVRLQAYIDQLNAAREELAALETQ